MNNSKLMLDLLSELLKSQKNNENIDADISLLLEVSIKNRVSTILYPIVQKKYQKNPLIEKDLLLWKEHAFYVASRNIFLYEDVKNVYMLLRKNTIEPIIFKGIALSRLYQNPLLRPIGDLDIFIKESEIKKARDILLENGYSQHEDDNFHPMHITLSKEKHLDVELHRNLIHFNYMGHRKVKNWYEHIWNHKQEHKFNGETYFMMSTEDELINQIIHFSTHFVYNGCKISHIFEIALLINSNSIDWEYVFSILDELNMLHFSKLIFSVCVCFFKVNIPSMSVQNKTANKFMDDFLNYFSYEKYRGYSNGWLNIVSNYRYILQSPYLLPLAWFIELKSQIELKQNINLLFRNTLQNIEAISKRIYYINKYKVISKGTKEK